MQNNRPIDDYPRVKKIGLFIFTSGIVPFCTGLVLIALAHFTETGAIDAIGLYMMGVLTMMQWWVYVGESNHG